jgi:ATP-dependent DNA helicase DinG
VPQPELPPVDELLAAAVDALGGSPREGQQQMAEAVTQAITDERHLLVQAGTGTGKSLGYLVPLVRHAMETGRPVLVSTATLALQAQVVERDLPRLADAIAPLVGRRPTFQLVKGRANYVCQHKLVGGFPVEDALFDAPAAGGGHGGGDSGSDTGGTRLGRQVVRLREWAETTESGDRDELVPGVSERAWRQVSVSAHECLGAQRCPVASECFTELARERARDVDVVVTNHALLAIDAFEGRQMLPEHEVVVIDEAHELADRVTSVVSDELTPAMVAAAATAARRHGEADTGELEVAGDDLEAVLEPLPEGRFTTALPEALQATVAGIRDAAQDVLRQMKDVKVDGEAAGAQQLARSRVSEVFDVAERLAALTEVDVAWLAVRDDGFAPVRRALHVAPLSVAGMLRDRLFSERTVVLTSATLTLGGTFDAAAGSVGLAGQGAPPWEGLDVGSPFDYPRQAILYVARHLPPPGRDGTAAATLDELSALVEAAGGRTLGLFSSRRAAEAAAEAMRERLDVPVLCQGDDQTATLIRQFAADPRTCLFGTLSLWQGVDVPGVACQLVVIDRIPFPRPDDPLMSARQEAASKAGGNGFMAVAATHAALRLAQGAGRLVRSGADRGVVAVLDSRLATARYGSFLRSSLPPLWPTTQREVALAALRRIDEAAAAAS